MTELVNVPGIGGSGPAHWQTLWEQRHAGIRRIAPASWEAPGFDNWIAALDAAVAASSTPPVLIAHSLGCLLVAHWTRHSRRAIAGAMLVAVPDPAAPAFPATAGAFGPTPTTRLPFPTLIVTSSDDPYGSLSYAHGCADHWGAGLVEAGALGHINGGSGLGDWPGGWQLLTAFCAGLRLAT